MTNLLKNQIIIDGLEYCNWNREILEDLWKGGITAIHATLVYWENTEAVSYTHLTLPTILLV